MLNLTPKVILCYQMNYINLRWIQMHVDIIWYGLTSSQQKESTTIVIIVMVGFKSM
jgi:hypothetical protein